MEKKQEEKLIRRLQRNNDRMAAGALIEAYYREIYTFAYKQTGDLDQAMDLTQEIFLAMLQSISTYNSNKASFRTWLYRIASNKIVDYFRSAHYRTKCKAVDLDGISLPAEFTLEEWYIDRQQKMQCLYAISELPFLMQQVLRLKCFGEITFREIAAMLSMPEGTVKTQYYKAIDILRKKVD